jgi:hypothetical protein
VTGTEMLMGLMAEWNRKGEPEEVIVVFLDHDQCVDYRTNCPHTRAIGLAQFALMGSTEAMREGSYHPRQRQEEKAQ